MTLTLNSWVCPVKNRKKRPLFCCFLVVADVFLDIVALAVHVGIVDADR